MANKYTNRELLDFNYKESNDVVAAKQQSTNAEQAFNNLGSYNFNYGRQADYDNAMDAILNRKKFSYDLNGDALYQQYKDNYINQGKMAMMDTMGQAAAMTGGYGNSYAATVGNQAYQASLQNLNNMIPELYKLALDSYNAEGDRLAGNLNVLGSDRQLEETAYNNKYNADLTRLSADRDYYNQKYNDLSKSDYSKYVDYLTSNNENYWNEYKQGYQEFNDNRNYELQSDLSSYQKRIASLEDEVGKTNYYKAMAEIGDGIQPVTRGSRGNTGNGGYSVLGSTYKSLDEAEKALAKYLDDLNLSEPQIIAIYEKLGM